MSGMVCSRCGRLFELGEVTFANDPDSDTRVHYPTCDARSKAGVTRRTEGGEEIISVRVPRIPNTNLVETAIQMLEAYTETPATGEGGYVFPDATYSPDGRTFVHTPTVVDRPATPTNGEGSVTP